MVFFNYATMQMAAKIVYYGPGLCGKTTNLHHIYAKTSPQSRGEMVSLETETDRTLFFDLLPIDVGVIGGFKTRLQLYTIPGQVFYNTTRKLVLKGVDGLVYVADRQHQRVQVFTTAGAFKQEAKVGGENNQMQGAAGLAFSPDRAQQFLYVGDLGNNQINILDRQSLKVVGKFGKGGTAPGDFNVLHEIAADAKGNIYTAETRSRRVQKFRPL